MKSLIYRISGLLLILAAILGWVFSIGGLFLTWRGAAGLSKQVVTTVQDIDTMLVSTSDLLTVLDITLDTVSEELTVVESSSKKLTETLDAVSSISSNLASLVGSDLPGIVKDIQSGLSSMESSARLVDDTLGLITRIPLLGSRYTPETPLSDTVNQVSTSLNSLPGSLSSMKGDLTTSSNDLKLLKGDIGTLTGSLGEIKASIMVMQTALDNYQAAVGKLKERTASFKANTPRIMTGISLTLTLFFFWLAAAMLSQFLQGMELLGTKKKEELDLTR